MSSLRVGRQALVLLRQNITRQRIPLLTHTRHASTQQGAEDEEDNETYSDYPQLPNVSRQYLPAKGWQDELMRRNHGDPLHEREELYSMWGPDIPPANLSPYTALLHFAIAASGIVGVGFLIKYALVPEMPAVRRQYPYDGLVKELGGLQENKARQLNEN